MPNGAPFAKELSHDEVQRQDEKLRQGWYGGFVQAVRWLSVPRQVQGGWQVHDEEKGKGK